MSRGNQREVDRARAQKRADKAGANKKKEGGGGNGKQALANKKESDAEIMRQKQAAAEQKKTAGK